MRPRLCRTFFKLSVLFVSLYLTKVAVDFTLTSIFSSTIPFQDGSMSEEVMCPSGPSSNSSKRHKLMNYHQFSAEDSGYPYLIESYRVIGLVDKSVKLLTRPVDSPCRNLYRFGNQEPGGHDGHWVCLDAMPPEEPIREEDNSNPVKCLVYSFGVGYDFSFEDQIIKRGCNVHSFDPSMMFMDHVRGEGVYFHRLGLFDRDSDDYAPFLGGYVKEPQIWQVRTLGTILKSLDHSRRNITVLKVDVEGSEWHLVEYLLFERPDLLSRIDQFIVEWHIGEKQQRQIDSIYKLSAMFRKCSGFLLVHSNYWRRDNAMRAFLTTFVNSKLLNDNPYLSQIEGLHVQ